VSRSDGLRSSRAAHRNFVPSQQPVGAQLAAVQVHDRAVVVVHTILAALAPGEVELDQAIARAQGAHGAANVGFAIVVPIAPIPIVVVAANRTGANVALDRDGGRAAHPEA
jgi:hypothetical protein